MKTIKEVKVGSKWECKDKGITWKVTRVHCPHDEIDIANPYKNQTIYFDLLIKEFKPL